MKPIFITGGNGQLGAELLRVFKAQGWPVFAPIRKDLDLTNLADLEQTLAKQQWAAVINAAAYTAVDSAETNPVDAWKINALAPVAMGKYCAEANVPLIHISTDYVFSGMKAGTWRVSDPTGPLGVYGASKLAGELAVRASGARHAIVRTSWLVSAAGSNFVKTMLRLAADRPKIRVVDDQVGNPTSAADLAQALATITTQLIHNPNATAGTLHFANAGSVSWAGFATEVFRQSALRNGPAAVVEPIPSEAYPTPARRPANSSLNCDSIEEHYQISPRRWQDALSDILDELIGTPE